MGFLYLPFVFLLSTLMPCLDNSKVNLLKVKHCVICFVNYYSVCTHIRHTGEDASEPFGQFNLT